MSNSLKVLALVTDAFGGRGGIAQYNRDFLSTLAASTRSSITVLPRLAPDPPTTPELIDQMRAQKARLPYSIKALLMALFRPLDVVFCGHLFMAPLAALIARLKGAKLIVQTHGIEAWPRPSRPRRAALEKANLVLCVSRYTRAALLTWASIAPERVLVLPNTVRDDFSPGDGSALRMALGLQSKRVLLTVGRLDGGQHYKGHDRVISSLSQLVAEGHDVVYAVVGEGSDRKRLETLSSKAGIADRVRFLGALDHQRLIEAYRMADVFVMPSVGEGFGIVYLEAMASGTPAIGLDAAGARDALADGELGTLVSEAKLPSALAHLLATPKQDARALATATRARFGRNSFAAGAHAAFNRLMEVT
jgi:phosphatidylinositol alpha-1,6-mannosyltransferase